MKSLIDSIGFLMLLGLAIGMITSMTVATMRFVLGPIFQVQPDPQLGQVVFLTYTLAWQVSIIVSLIRQRKKL